MSEREIHSLDRRTVERIAAGEVVERPASVVKELVENSVDAEADRIDVTVENGGVDRIRVTDDGIGIPPEELERAVDKHTTSKLRDATHLEAGIETLGFRGEALHTIGAVSRMQITTRRDDADVGAQLTVTGGDRSDVTRTGTPPGTTVEVEDLFYNTPARRSFLGATETEFDHINRIVTEYALANPDIAFALRHGDRDVFTTTGRGNLQEAVLAVWGRDVAESMYALESVESDPVDGLSGMMSDPETTRSRPRYLATFVNGRAVRSSSIRDGILDGYDTEIAPDRFPFVVLFCEVDPAAVDVNVHPRKTEVRFHEPDAITNAIATAIRETLSREGIIRTTAPRGRGQPSETFVPSFGNETPSSTDFDRSGPSVQSTPSPTSTRPPTFTAATSQQTFDGNEPAPGLEQLPNLRILGQLAETYIVAEADGELVLVDQHAADERIHFERLRTAFEGESLTQELVEPIDVTLTGDEVAAFATVEEALDALGFDAHLVEDGVRVTRVPTIFDATVAPERIRDAIAGAIEWTEPGPSVDAIARALIADMACHPAVTGNVSLAEGPMIELLEALDDCENPYACPHGRPTIIRIDAQELGDRFERDYPGHAIRRRDSP